MSAYGAIHKKGLSAPLPSTLWRLRSSRGPESPAQAPVPAGAAATHLTIHHLTLPRARALPGLLPFLHSVFADELARGLTYPQEVAPGEAYTLAMFEAYYFSGDVLVAVLGGPETLADSESGSGCSAATQAGGGTATTRSVGYGIEEARDGRRWEDCIAGCYYVKPNYPGRSSHICNAGFLVPPAQRGRGVGSALARSFLHYAPRLGYEASVFNLVYANNTASVRLWESLNFSKAGLIPRAGRLKKADGSAGEEFVDAWVFYRRFDAVE